MVFKGIEFGLKRSHRWEMQQMLDGCIKDEKSFRRKYDDLLIN